VLVDGDPLMGQRIDKGCFGREGGVEEVAMSQPFPFGDGSNDPGIRGEVDSRGRFGCKLREWRGGLA
jgi:hypothetical protein